MQILANGITAGLTTALLAVAFAIVYLPTRIFYIALGGVYVLASYVALSVTQTTGSFTVGTIAAVATGVILSVGCELLNHAPLDKRGASMGAHLIASLGLYIIFVQTAALTWGENTRTLPSSNAEMSLTIWEVSLDSAQVLGASVSLITLALFFIWLNFSNLGLQFRALADNAKELSLRGFSIRNLRMLAFGISGGLASVSAVLTSYDVGFNPHVGLSALLIAIVAAIIGGRFTFLGPIIGALLLEVVRAEVAWIFSSRWQEVATFVILIAFLYARPQGIINRSSRVESEA